jgi:hypothetical protein
VAVPWKLHTVEERLDMEMPSWLLMALFMVTALGCLLKMVVQTPTPLPVEREKAGIPDRDAW